MIASMRRWWVVGWLLLVACSEDPPPSMDGVGAEVPAPERPARERPEPILDGDGVPLPSDARVAGLTLPRGLTAVEALDTERRHHYTSEVPVNALIRYFGPRLTTVQIDREAGRTIYRDAVPRGVRGGVVRLDVTIRTSSAHAARVEIYERPPPAPEGLVITPDEIRRHLEAPRE